MPEQISLESGLVQILVQLAPSFVLVCIMFIIFSFIRLLIDKMSGRGL